ncbi:MAG: LysM peptidoglycan-binding domain-containing protein [Candidatus Omnitrophica bacterium]|nr:LysM peptidoglycan-binding domain-containing protein [Candidatus Omnitrophota bacterium]
MIRTVTTFLSILVFFSIIANNVCAADYIVNPGDTLIKISEQHLGDNGRWREIAEQNQLKPPYAIHAGQKLVLPSENSNNFFANPIKISDTKLISRILLIYCLVSIIFSTFSLKITCWFFCIKCTLKQCLGISLIFLLMTSPALLSYPFFETHLQILSVLLFVFGLAATILSVAIIKKILKCKWRQAMGLYLVAGFVSHILYFLFNFFGMVGIAVSLFSKAN